MKLALVIVLGLLWGCRTLPDSAPAELFAARDALLAAEAQNVGYLLPVTMARASSSYDLAYQDFKKSLAGTLAPPARLSLRHQAVSHAIRARNLAQEALDLGKSVSTWDQNIETYAVSKQQADLLASTTAELEMTRQKLAQYETMGFELRTPIAFFETGKTSVNEHSRPHIEDLAAIMQEEASIYVTLIGYTDPRGSPTSNQLLARQRAQYVAHQLQKRGIDRDRIEIISLGEVEARSHDDAALLQLDRRVDVQLGVGEQYAH